MITKYKMNKLLALQVFLVLQCIGVFKKLVNYVNKHLQLSSIADVEVKEAII